MQYIYLKQGSSIYQLAFADAEFYRYWRYKEKLVKMAQIV